MKLQYFCNERNLPFVTQEHLLYLVFIVRRIQRFNLNCFIVYYMSVWLESETTVTITTKLENVTIGGYSSSKAPCYNCGGCWSSVEKPFPQQICHASLFFFLSVSYRNFRLFQHVLICSEPMAAVHNAPTIVFIDPLFKAVINWSGLCGCRIFNIVPCVFTVNPDNDIY